MRIGVIGRGNFGKKLLSKLEKLADVVFVTGKDLQIQYDIDWVFVASSNESHYEIVKDFLQNRVNVFCEKPLTLSTQQTLELVQLSKDMEVTLYIDDVFRYHTNYQHSRSTLLEAEELTFVWNKYGSFKDTIYSNLMYHDLYILIDLLGEFTIQELTYSINTVNKKECNFQYCGKNIKFKYNRAELESKKTINSFSFDSPINDALYDMVEQVLRGTVDIEYNHRLAIHTQQLLDQFSKYVPTVAVVGAGIFGITAALKLDRVGLNVTLFDKNNDILQNASNINQYRVHRGYHYPRSKDTAISAKEGALTFLQEYDCLSKDCEHHYCIASERSLIDSDQYTDFLDKVQLEYDKVPASKFNITGVDLTVQVKEQLFNPYKLKEIAINKLSQFNVKLKLGYTFTKKDTSKYDYVINCTYSDLNQLVDSNDQQDYQYEICEKPVVKLPVEYRGKSVVVLDGPFTCIDPLADTNYHVMGNVVHAIHHTNTGKKPDIPLKFKSLLNRGVIPNPTVTNIDKFIESACKFFPGIEQAQHIGSMYTIRTVLPRRDYDDARPSIVKKHSDKMYSLFSGKIATCVDSADELVNYIMHS